MRFITFEFRGDNPSGWQAQAITIKSQGLFEIIYPQGNHRNARLHPIGCHVSSPLCSYRRFPASIFLLATLRPVSHYVVSSLLNVQFSGLDALTSSSSLF